MKPRRKVMIAVSIVDDEKLNAYRQRLGWNFKWLSTSGNDFAYDLHASYTAEKMTSGALINYKMAKPRPQGFDDVAISVFSKAPNGEVFHTYSTYSRGVDMMNGAYHCLGRNPSLRGWSSADIV
jgi:predicted dithiol-disulfide oxidoreductase (DUF899 family)